ncbi:MAG: protein kinase domain-containing protein [Solirubrobacteraceae bacterium]
MKPIARTNDLTGIVLDGRYELHAVVGEGAFGRVYRGLDRRLARTVAAKVIKAPWSEDPEWVESFEREARMLARVSDPGIVQIFDVGQAPEGLYYIAEFVDGESLATRLTRGSLPQRDACDIAEQLCRALAHAHAQRIVHRDIKPANILISTQGRVKVGDFGVARLAESTTEIPAAAVVGTPRYMAPEQARGLRTTPSVDIYSAGIVLYEMLAGSTPFTGSSSVELAMRHAYDRPAPLPAQTPRELVNVVVRAIAKDPAERFRDAQSMADALAGANASALSNERTAAVPASPDDMRTVSLPPAAAPRRHATEDTGKRSATRGEGERSATQGDGERSATEGNGKRRVGERNGATASTRCADRTRIAPLPLAPATPPRELNPAARRRNLAVLVVGCAIVLAMIAGAILLPGSAPAKVTTPKLLGLSESSATARARNAGLRPRFSHRYSSVAVDTAISQQPGPGALAAAGSIVRVVLSAGPAPVEVPRLVDQSATAASSILTSLGLKPNVTTGPAPGILPGTVTGQDPTAGTYVARQSSVALSVAETPTWRPLTSLSGSGGGHTVPFRIVGTRFRVVYHLSYDGLCELIFFCSGPTAQVVNLRTSATVSRFGLQDGGTQTQVEPAGAGLYEVSITPGPDSASWSLEVDDYY